MKRFRAEVLWRFRLKKKTKQVGFTDPQARSLTMTVASGHSSKILFQWLRSSSSVVRTGEAAEAFNYAQLLRTVDRPLISTQQSEVCPPFRQQAVAVLKPCTKVHGSSVADPIATCSVCSHATVTNLRVGLPSSLFWTYYMVSVTNATLLNEGWISE